MLTWHRENISDPNNNFLPRSSAADLTTATCISLQLSGVLITTLLIVVINESLTWQAGHIDDGAISDLMTNALASNKISQAEITAITISIPNSRYKREKPSSRQHLIVTVVTGGRVSGYGDSVVGGFPADITFCTGKIYSSIVLFVFTCSKWLHKQFANVCTNWNLCHLAWSSLAQLWTHQGRKKNMRRKRDLQPTNHRCMDVKNFTNSPWTVLNYHGKQPIILEVITWNKFSVFSFLLLMGSCRHRRTRTDLHPNATEARPLMNSSFRPASPQKVNLLAYFLTKKVWIYIYIKSSF